MMHALSYIAMATVIGIGSAWGIFITDVHTENTVIARKRAIINEAYKRLDEITLANQELQQKLAQAPRQAPPKECPAPTVVEVQAAPPAKLSRPRIINECPAAPKMTGICALLECDR